MKITAYKTPCIHPGDSLYFVLDTCLPALKEKSMVAITSKVISLCQNRIVYKEKSERAQKKQKQQLIKQHADAWLKLSAAQKKRFPYANFLTIKNHALIPAAGIDESNGGDHLYILYPQDIFKTAVDIWHFLRKKHKLSYLGILITDSHTTPLRRGVTGIGMGWCGFEAFYNYIGQPDCFGRMLKISQTNTLDALAASAVYVMGEGNEQTPLAILSEIPRLVFQTRPPSAEEKAALAFPPGEDIYAPFFHKPNRWVTAASPPLQLDSVPNES